MQNQKPDAHGRLPYTSSLDCVVKTLAEVRARVGLGLGLGIGIGLGLGLATTPHPLSSRGGKRARRMLLGERMLVAARRVLLAQL